MVRKNALVIGVGVGAIGEALLQHLLNEDEAWHCLGTWHSVQPEFKHKRLTWLQADPRSE